MGEARFALLLGHQAVATSVGSHSKHWWLHFSGMLPARTWPELGCRASWWLPRTRTLLSKQHFQERAGLSRDGAGSASPPPSLSGPPVSAPNAPCQGDSCVSPMINEEPAELTRSVLLGPP